MSSDARSTSAASHAIATILLVTITIILALLILLMFQLPQLNDQGATSAIFIITNIENVDEITHTLNYDSRVLLQHAGTGNFQNEKLKARFFKNGQLVNCNIATLNGHDFISTVHTGIQWMGGTGCSGLTWSPGERICLDFTDGTFHPGDTVQVDIIDKTTSQIISRHIYHA